MISPSHPTRDSSADIIKIAILAVGGQGGGVLTNWIADLAARGGYDAQMTSVAGVAQRTGATIYYVEMAPKSDQGPPVLALSPVPGDVDILIASELMEAGRAVLRGFVTPDRTTLITSSHRILSVHEKQVPGNGRADGGLVSDKIEQAAAKLVCFDMEKITLEAGSVISSTLFGGLARSGALPFETALYEEVIRASGRGVDASLRAFHAALTYNEDAEDSSLPPTSPSTMMGPAALQSKWEDLRGKIDTLPEPAHEMAHAGLGKVVDYQDLAYGEDYLAHLDKLTALDSAERGYELTKQGAKYIANAMCYDDIIRVADLKTRATRQNRLRGDQQIAEDDLYQVTEYFHPRAEEICLTMPAGIGRRFRDSPRLTRLLNRVFNKGRRIRTDRISGFVPLWVAARLRPMRRKLLRHVQETAHLDLLMKLALETAPRDYALAVEILKTQRLVKGYSDTHARGQSKFKRVIGALSLLNGREDAAEWLTRLRNAALEDEQGDALDGAIQTIQSFASDTSGTES